MTSTKSSSRAGRPSTEGDYETAQRLLTLVQEGDPRHGPTRALLAQIKLAAPPDGEFLKKKYSSIVLQKVEMEEVSLQDCLQGLIIISKNATEGKLAPNLILQAKDKADAKVTMNLSNIPLPEAIDYVARLSGTKVKWEKHAVVFLGVGGLTRRQATCKVSAVSETMQVALISGGEGDLARELNLQLSRAGWQVLAPNRSEMDVTSTEAVSGLLPPNPQAGPAHQQRGHHRRRPGHRPQRGAFQPRAGGESRRCLPLCARGGETDVKAARWPSGKHRLILPRSLALWDKPTTLRPKRVSSASRSPSLRSTADVACAATACCLAS